MSPDIEPVDATLAELKEKYPVGTILRVTKSRPATRDDMVTFEAVVTGHSEVTNDGRMTYKHPGPRVNVSTSPIDLDWQNDGDVGMAAACRPSDIDDVVGQIDN